MSLIRLSSITKRYTKLHNENKSLPNLEGLEEEIFPDFKSEDMNPNFIYISHTIPKLRDDLAIYLGYNTGELIIGDYEYSLIKLLINSKEPIFCISGHMGSGKSSTLRYIIKILRDATCSYCETKGDCPHRKYIMINFNQIDYPLDEKTAKSQLATDIYFKIREAISDTGVIDDKEELSKFWHEMVKGLPKANYEFRVFVNLSHIIADEYSSAITSIETITNNEDLLIRKKIRKKLLENPEHGLEYYFHLWRYILKNKFKNQHEHLMLFFDNIDNSNPGIQTALVNLLSTYAANPGIRCVITVRPETFESSHLNRSSGFIRLENHRGPNPDKVICNNIRNFIDKYKMPNKSHPEKIKEFEFFRSYLGKVLELNSTKNSNQYLTINNFIHQACGPSIRLSIKLADGLLLLDDEILHAIENDTLSTFHIVRGLIKRGKSFFSTSNFERNYHPIESIFDVPESNESGRLLVKTRILTYLNNETSNSATLSDLRKTLARFNYTETDLIRNAINDLQHIQRQLIRSTSLDGYQTPEEFQGAGTSKISITEIGKGYLELIGNLDFLQEVLFDVRINSTWEFPSNIEINSIPDTLIAIWRFLKILYIQDVEETRNFLYTPNGYKDFIEYFGSHPISWIITKKIYSSVRKIIYSALANKSMPISTKDAYMDVRGRFDQLLQDLRTSTDSLLSIKLEMPEEYHLRDPKDMA